MLDCLKHLGLRGRLGAFLEELYSGVECEDYIYMLKINSH